jgi:hypothetical protein
LELILKNPFIPNLSLSTKATKKGDGNNKQNSIKLAADKAGPSKSTNPSHSLFLAVFFLELSER